MAQTTNDDRLSTPGAPPQPDSGKTDAAREEAAHLKDTTVAASQQVMETAKDKVQDVADDVRRQTSRLTSEARNQVSSQATDQRDRAASWLRSMGDELDQMAGRTEQGGWGTQLAREGSRLSGRAAEFLEQHEPDQILDEVRSLARRRPGAFLLGAAVAGVVAGRLTRAMTGSSDSTPASGSATTRRPSGTTPAAGAATAPGETVMMESPGMAGTTTGMTGTAAAGTTGAPMPGTTPGGSPEDLGVTDPMRMPPPEPTASVPDPDPGAPVTPRFGPDRRE
jgi:hypothetical protein